MNSKTKKWICDQCENEISSIEDGEYKSEGIRIVHRIGCLYNEEIAWKSNKLVADTDLETFSGPDGLMNLWKNIIGIIE